MLSQHYFFSMLLILFILSVITICNAQVYKIYRLFYGISFLQYPKSGAFANKCPIMKHAESVAVYYLHYKNNIHLHFRMAKSKQLCLLINY